MKNKTLRNIKYNILQTECDIMWSNLSENSFSSQRMYICHFTLNVSSTVMF